MFSKTSTDNATEVFTLTEGTVTISFPKSLSGESIGDLKKYLDIFVEKVTRQGEDPHDAWEPTGQVAQASNPAKPPNYGGMATVAGTGNG